MSRVGIESADALDRLADEIDRTADELERESSSVKGELEELGDTWRDASFSKFEGKYYESSMVIGAFINDARRFANYLREHARLDREAEDYDV